MKSRFIFVPLGLLVIGLAAAGAAEPLPRSLKTPLAQETLELLANELSGQIVYNNLVKLAGAPWLRREAEFAGTFYEAQAIHELVEAYGISTTRLERYPGAGSFDSPAEGELWVNEPRKRLVARLEADPALVVRGCRSGDVTGELVDLARADHESLRKTLEAAPAGKYQGKVALMWSHPGDADAKALAAAGVRGVISFNSRERYFDPDQVVYSAGPYDRHDPLAMGFSVSWRQWSELLEDVQSGQRVVVRMKARVEKRPEKFEIVYSWIPGSEPDGKGVAFTAHLFDGFVKRGANDNMSGCAVQLEILRALVRLIERGELPRPRRTIHFLWPAEISGTYAFLERHPDFGQRLSININMDMVGEGLRKCNAALRMSQCPGHLPSYLDGLAASVLNYLWRTNDVIFQSEGPRGRPGGQYFPLPMVEKNGSLDAFRFTICPAIGGSDHVCFNNPSVAVPGLMFLVWPDQWYHADTDTPDKADPTQLKRSAFLGAACAWAAACCTDDVAVGLAEAAADYGYRRVAERELPRAMARLDSANSGNLASQTAHALRLVAFGAGREARAIGSIQEICSGSAAAHAAVHGKARQWEHYAQTLHNLVSECARTRAAELGTVLPGPPPADALEQKYRRIRPVIAAPVKGRQFKLAASEAYREYMKDRPKALERIGISPAQATAVLNYVTGRFTAAEIGDCVAAELDQEVRREAVWGYLELLKAVGWIEF